MPKEKQRLEAKESPLRCVKVPEGKFEATCLAAHALEMTECMIGVTVAKANHVLFFRTQLKGIVKMSPKHIVECVAVK